MRLNRSGVSRNVLLGELNVQTPSVALGFFKLPATAVGTQVERTVNETIGAMCTQQMNAHRAVLLWGSCWFASIVRARCQGVDTKRHVAH